MYSNSNFNVSAGGNVLNAGTSTINFSGSTPSVGGTGSNPVFTYYNVNFTNTSSSSITVNGTNTFNNFSVSALATLSSIAALYFANNQTINGTLTMSGASYTQRLFVQSSSLATSITLTVAAVSALSYIDFGSITVAGASAPWSGTSIGDLQNNVNITTSTPKIVYWNAPNVVGNWSPSNGTIVWATSSGGATSVANFPLAQDTCIFDNTGLGTTGTVNYDRNWSLGNINFSAVTNPATFSMGSYPAFYLNVIFSSSLTLTQTASTYALFMGAGTQVLVSAGLAFPAGILAGQRGTSSSTLTLSGAARCGEGFGLNTGILNLANNTLTCSYFASNNTNTRSIAFGTGQIYLTGNNATIWTFNNGAGLTVTGSAIVNATYSGSTGTRFFLGYAVGSAVINVNFTAGTDIARMDNYGFNNINFTGFTGSVITGIGGVGNITLGAGMTVTSATSWSMFGTSGTQLFTSNGVTLNAPITFLGTGGSYMLADALTVGSTRTVTLTSGTLNLNNNNLTCGLFNSDNSNIRSMVFGTAQVYVTGNSNYIINMNNMAGLTYSGSGVFNATYSGATGFRGLIFSNASEANSLNLNVTAGTDQVQIYGTGFRNINLTGFAGTWIEAGDRTIYGDLTISTGMTVTATSVARFSGSGIQNITSNNKTLFPITKITGTGTLRLVDALTLNSNKSFTLQTGTLDLNGNSLTCGYFEASSSNVTINFSGANIYVSGAGANVFYVTPIIAYTGIPNIYLTNSGSSGTRYIYGNNAAYPLNYFITGGTDNIVLNNALPYGPINFTGFGGTFGAMTTNITLNGDLTLSSSMTFAASSGSIQFTNSNNRNITTNGVTINIVILLSGGTLTFQSAVTIGSAYYINFYGGTLNLNNYNFTVSNIFTNTAPVSVAFGTGTTTITGSGTVFNNGSVTISASGTGKISLTSASSKVFNGFGGIFPTISQDGAGILYINGNNTYQDMTATVFPSTIDFGSGGTHSFYNFSVVGTAGNLVTVNCFIPGNTVNFVNLSGHNLGGNYMYLQDIHANPANTWYGGRNTTNVSNNTGWVFYNYYPVSIVENSALADVKTNTAKFNASVIEALVNADSDTLGQASYHVATSEPTTIGSAITASATLNSAIVERLTALSSQLGSAKFVVSRTENSTLGDSETNLKKLYSAIIESATVANTQSSIARYQRSVVENFYPQSTQSNLALFKSTVIETTVVFDSSIGRGWFNIPDGQTPNWTNINDYQ